MAITPVTENPGDNWFGYGERKGSCDEDYDFMQGTVEATRKFIGPWDNRGDFLRYKLLAEVNPGENGDNQSITPPNAYPDIPTAFAYKASVRGIFVAGQNENDVYQIKYDLAEITVHYKLFPFGWPGGNGGNPERLFIEEQVESTTEIIPIPYNFTVIDDSPGYRQQGITKIKGQRDGKLNKVITIEHYKLTVPIVIQPNFLYFDVVAGSVNLTSLTLPSGYVVTPEQFRYDGWSGVTKRELGLGQLVWSITHSFAFYYPGWNTLPAAALSDPADINSDVELINAPITPPLYESLEHNYVLYGQNYTP
jgi:hypothetical protein